MLKAYETSGNILFEEKQRHPKWIEKMLLFSSIMIMLVMITSLIIGKGKTDDLIASAILVPGLILVVYFNSNILLEKVVTSNALYFKWKPWHKKYRVIEREDIESVIRRKFLPFSYGFGWFPGYGKYYNANSGEGLQLYLKNGNRFYFSTADVDSFKRAMDQMINPLTKSNLSEF